MSLREQVRQVAFQYGIPPDLAERLVQQESAWNPRAVSPAGAEGLLQLMPGTQKRQGVTDPFDPTQSIEGGLGYLAEQYEDFGTWPLALAAYNAGPGAVRKHGGVPPYKETQNYVNKIWGNRQEAPPMIRQPTMQPSMPGLLPPPQSQPLLPPPQFQQPSLFNDPRFWLTSAATMASAGNNMNPIGALAMGLAAGQQAVEDTAQQRFKNEMDQYRIAQGLGQATRPPSDIQSIQELVRMGVPLPQALRMRYPSGTTYGTTIQERGGVTYREQIHPGGLRTMEQLQQPEREYREDVLEAEAGAGARGSAFGKLDVEMRKNTSEAFQTISSSLASTDRMLHDFESGRFDDVVGPITGRITPYFDPDAAVAQLRNLDATMQQLGAVNLAPISNYEVELVRKMSSSPTMTKEQNIAILKEIQRSLRTKKRVASEILQRLKTESIDDILLNPPEVNFTPQFDFAGGDSVGMPGAAPETPEAWRGSLTPPTRERIDDTLRSLEEKYGR